MQHFDTQPKRNYGVPATELESFRMYYIWICEFYRNCRACFEVRANHDYKTVANCSPLAVCVHVYWKGILVQRELEYTRMSLVLISREVLGKGKRIWILEGNGGSIIPTCNTIFKLMVYKQHAGTHVYTKLQSKHLEDVLMIKILKYSTGKKMVIRLYWIVKIYLPLRLIVHNDVIKETNRNMLLTHNRFMQSFLYKRVVIMCNKF